MPRPWRRGAGSTAVPEAVRAMIGAVGTDRLLSWAQDTSRGETLVAGANQLYAVSSDGAVVTARPWHLVDAGRWDHDTFTLTVTWVDGARPQSWRIPDRTLLPETVRERVQASVVLAETVALGGRRSARVVLRRNLATGELVGQTLLGRGVRAADPGVSEATTAALEGLREQVGLT